MWSRTAGQAPKSAAKFVKSPLLHRNTSTSEVHFSTKKDFQIEILNFPKNLHKCSPLRVQRFSMLIHELQPFIRHRKASQTSQQTWLRHILLISAQLRLSAVRFESNENFCFYQIFSRYSLQVKRVWATPKRDLGPRNKHQKVLHNPSKYCFFHQKESKSVFIFLKKWWGNQKKTFWKKVFF